MQAGGRRQLDIPADLAYGDREMGAAIPPNSALSFVVDMIAVVPATDAADEPSVDISAADNVSELVITDLIVGDGPAAEAGAKAVLHLVAFRADTAAQITSTWASPQPLSFELSERGNPARSRRRNSGHEGRRSPPTAGALRGRLGRRRTIRHRIAGRDRSHRGDRSSRDFLTSSIFDHQARKASGKAP